jgi:flagellin-like protein
MDCPHRERALSEIVGFILILAVIVVVAMLYLTFGIPAQGREGEISHMNEVKDRFVGYKVDIDSLWSNRQCGTAIGTSITLGTGGGATTGSLSILPILSPVRTTGTLALNQRAEYLTIDTDSNLYVNTEGTNQFNESGNINAAPAPYTPITFNTTPRHFFIDLYSPVITQQMGVNVYGSTWSAWVNMTPIYTFSHRYVLTNDTEGRVQDFQDFPEYTWNSTDVTISTEKMGVPVVTDLAIYRKIAPSTNYTVDLMESVSGISTDLASPQTFYAERSNPLLNGTFITNYSYWRTTSTQSWLMGSLEYKSQNEYWIPQTYYYQMGGIFLEQNDGNSVKLPPSFTFTETPDSIPMVAINQILLSGSGVVSGSGPAQVTSSVTSITETPLIDGNNTRSVNITVRAANTNAALMWLQFFNNSAAQAGFSPSIFTSGTGGLDSFICIQPDPKIYGVRLSMNQVNVNMAIQSAAPSVAG